MGPSAMLPLRVRKFVVAFRGGPAREAAGGPVAGRGWSGNRRERNLSVKSAAWKRRYWSATPCSASSSQAAAGLEGRLSDSLAAAVRPARACLTSRPCDQDRSPSGAVGADAVPTAVEKRGTTAIRWICEIDSTTETGTARPVTSFGGPLNHRARYDQAPCGGSLNGVPRFRLKTSVRSTANHEASVSRFRHYFPLIWDHSV